MPRQGARRSVADGARRDAAIEVDRRGRLAGGSAGAARRPPQEPRTPGLGRRRATRALDRLARRSLPCAPAPGCAGGAKLDSPPRKDDVPLHQRCGRPPRGLPRRTPDRLHRARLLRQGRSVGALPGQPGCARAPRNGRRDVSVLVAGRPSHRVLRRRQAEEDRGRGRTDAGPLRRRRRPGRNLEQGRRHPLRAALPRASLSSGRDGRKASARDEVRRGSARDDAPLSRVPAGREALSVRGGQPYGRDRQRAARHLPGLARRGSSAAPGQRAFEGPLRRRASPLRAAEDAHGATLRREEREALRRAVSDRRQRPGGPRFLHRGLLRLGQRRARLPGGGRERRSVSVDLVRPRRKEAGSDRPEGKRMVSADLSRRPARPLRDRRPGRSLDRRHRASRLDAPDLRPVRRKLPGLVAGRQPGLFHVPAQRRRRHLSERPPPARGPTS